VSAAVLLLAGPARAQPAPVGSSVPVVDDGPSPEARAANAKALELSRDGKYGEALELFQRAYDLSPSYVILYNIGRMARLTQDFARSLTAFQGYLKEGGIDIEPDRRTEVEREIASLSSLVSWVSVTAEPGARVSIDGRDVGVAPFEHKIVVNPGARTFRAEKAGALITKDLTAKVGETSVVDLRPRPRPTREPARPEAFRFPRGLIIGTWVAAGAFTGVAIGTGSAAIVMSNDLKNDVYVGPDRAPSPDSPIARKASRVSSLATTTDIIVVAAAVTGATAMTLTLVDAVMGSSQDAKSPPPSVDAGIGLGGLTIRGSF
jgi:hypothetical protein